MTTRTDHQEEPTGEEETKSYLEDIVNSIKNLFIFYSFSIIS